MYQADSNVGCGNVIRLIYDFIIRQVHIHGSSYFSDLCFITDQNCISNAFFLSSMYGFQNGSVFGNSYSDLLFIAG